MKHYKIYLAFLLLIIAIPGCKKQLDVKNPNQPTPDGATTEQGILSLAQGSVYVNGFRDLKYGDGVFGLFWSGAIGFHEMMGDVIGAEAANAYENQIGCPDKVTLDNGTVVLNPNAPNTQIATLRAINQNANLGNNPMYYEWAYMYSLNNAANSVLEVVANTKFNGDGATKLATIQAWAYWWKGFAYSRIASTYYAGLIINKSGATNGNYVTKEALLAEANSNFDKAATLLSGITNVAVYSEVLGKLIPDFCQVGNGGVLTPDMWKRNISTMKARNILVNNTVATMTPANWQAILTLTNAGIQLGDKVFTGRSNSSGDFLSSSSGTVSARTQSNLAGGSGYKLSERFVQEFKTGDKRFTQNFKQTATWFGNSDRGNAFNTRFALVNRGTGLTGVYTYANTDDGQYELFLAGNYEENQLMKAEALIYTGNIDGGLAIVDAVRTKQGAGLAAVAGTGLTLDQAKEELRRERRVTVAFRGLSFYDARRWGVILPVAQGGGRKGAVVVSNSGAVSTNATIEYNFLDYWDVPDNELAYNPPAAGSAPTKNPK
jgi:starch-binding outer membrane protein, SusD/RagB family